MAKNKNHLIDQRICVWVESIVQSGIYKSEAEFLRSMGFETSKLSNARNGKSGFTATDIGNILMEYPELNAEWIMTGRGKMYLSDSVTESNKDTLTQSPEERMRLLEIDNRELLLEVGRLRGKLEALTEKNEGLSQSSYLLDIRKKEEDIEKK